MAIEIEEQHPIPQDISSYQFRLVGDMTLKQFLQVAAGVLIAMFLYASNLHPFIKWPLVLFSAGLGAALAFLPLMDRPLGTWIIIFFRSVYSPTILIYKKPKSEVNYYAPEGTQVEPVAPAPAHLEEVHPLKEAARDSVSGTEFVSPAEEKVLTNLERKEKSFLSRITGLFSTPNLKPDTGKSGHAQTNMNIPEPLNISVSSNSSNTIVQSIPDSLGSTKDNSASFVTPILTTKKPNGQSAPQTDSSASPVPPTRPNIVVGQVLDDQGKIIEGAILEIKDMDGRPVRALKTNKLGHFMIVTPLFDGDYQLIVDNDELNFEPVKFQAAGKIIEPILLKATKESEKLVENQN